MRFGGGPRFIAWVLVFQFLLQPFALASSNSSSIPPSQSDVDVGEIQELLEDGTPHVPDLSRDEKDAQIEGLSKIFSGESDEVHHPLDTYGLYDWIKRSEWGGKGPRLNVDPRNLAVQFVDAQKSDEVIYSARTNVKDSLFTSPVLSPPRRFEILHEGEVLLESRFEVSQLLFFKNYLVFLEPRTAVPNRAAETSGGELPRTIQYVSFIDLKAFRALLGNEPYLPIFSFPVGVDGEVKSLRVENGKLKLGADQEVQIPRTVFEAFSDIHQTTMNVSAALLTPETYESAQSAVEQLHLYFLQGARQAAADLPGQLHHFEEHISKLREGLKARQTVVGQLQANAGFGTAISNKEEAILRVKNYQKALESDPSFGLAISKVQDSVRAQRKLNARLQILWHRLSLPRPAEAPMKLREALATMVAGFRAEKGAPLLKEGALQTINHDLVKWGMIYTTGILLGTLFPEHVAHFYEQAFNAGAYALNYALHLGIAVPKTFWAGTKTVLSGIGNPSVFYNTYVNNGILPHFIMGLAGNIGTALAIVALPILTVSSWRLARDLSQADLPKFDEYLPKEAVPFRSPGQSKLRALLDYIGARVDYFVDRQRGEYAAYLIERKNEMAKKSLKYGSVAAVQFTEEQHEQVDIILKNLHKEKERWVKKFFLRVSRWRVFRKKTYAKIDQEPNRDLAVEVLPVQVEAAPDSSLAPLPIEDSEEIIADAKIRSFSTALGNFVYGLSSITPAFKTLVHAWNGFTIFRRVAWNLMSSGAALPFSLGIPLYKKAFPDKQFGAVLISPTWFLQILYPNFINRSMGSSGKKEQVFPTVLNGGKMNPWETGKRVYQVLTFDKNLEALQAWEGKIIPVEKVIMGAALKEAFRGLTRFISERSEGLKELIDAGSVTSLNDPKLSLLTMRQRIFFRQYFEALFQLGMDRYLRKLSESVEPAQAQNLLEEAQPTDSTQAIEIDADTQSEPLDTEDMPTGATLRKLKDETLHLADSLEISEEYGESLVTEIAKEGRAFDMVAGQVESVSLKLQTFLTLKTYQDLPKIMDTWLRHEGLKEYAPEANSTTQRIQVVLSMLQRADTMPRAVRASLSALLMAKTVGMLMDLFAYAGVADGINKPIYNEMFGPNSYFYLSRNIFMGHILIGLFLGMFNSVWSKVQTDSQHAEEFGEVPTGEDAKLSYLGWLYKKTFQNPKNSYKSVRQHQVKITLAGMAPYFVLNLMRDMITLGRLDFDGYIIGYILWWFSPFTGLSPQIEQGVDLASYHYLKHFPPELRAHPKVLSGLEKSQQKQRTLLSAWENTVWGLAETVLEVFSRITMPEYGREALSRLMFFGWTPTEVMYARLNGMKPIAGLLPGGEKAVEACQFVFGHNYKAWEKVHPDGEDKK